MSQIEKVFVPVDDNLNPGIKFEPGDDEDGHPHFAENTSKDRDKMGEIFRTSDKHWRLVCVYCSHEFGLFDQFISHIEEHLKEIFDTSLEIKSERDSFDDENFLQKDDAEARTPNDVSIYLSNKSDNCKTIPFDSPNVKVSEIECPECGKTFSSACNMRRHLQLHSTEKKFNCKICNKKFIINAYLLLHLKVAHKIEDNYYSCDKCGNTFTYKRDLEKHLKDHNEMIESAHTCLQCGRGFSNSFNMRRHVKKIHGLSDDMYRCLECGDIFTYSLELREHMKSHESADHKEVKWTEDKDKQANEVTEDEDNGEMYSCPECGKKYSNRSNMRRHLNKHSAKSSCQICGKKLSDIAYVHEHMRTIHKIDNVYDCDECGQAFKYQIDLNKHIKKNHHHMNEEKKHSKCTFECYMCHMTFKLKVKLRYHQRGHWMILIPCKICGQTFKFESTLKRHMLFHGQPAKDIVKCDQANCNMSFTSHKYFRLHLGKDHLFPKYKSYRKQNKKEPQLVLRCDLCPKTFLSKTNLRSHMIIHIPKPHREKFTCHICGSGFYHRSNLTKHMNKHDREKQFTCDICHKTFRKEYKNDHLRTHTKERPFQCTMCGRTFTAYGGLTRHMECHSKEPKYKCDLCPKKYTRSDNLRIHRRTHTGEFIYNCTDCKKGFTENRSLKKHMLSYHGRPLDGSAVDSVK